MTAKLKMSIAILAAMIGGFLTFQSVFAISAPDSLSIISAECFGGTLEAGDIICVTRYDIEYTSIPDEAVEESFLNNFLSSTTDGTIRVSTPMQKVNSGYGQGVASVYFSADDASSLGVSWGAAHRTEIEGNPSVFSTLPSISDLFAWIQETDGGDELGNHVITLGQALQDRAEWSGLTLVETTGSGEFLTADGIEYFIKAIPALRSMSPSIFPVSIIAPTIDDLSYTNEYQSALDAQWNTAVFSDTFVTATNYVPAPESMLKLGFAAIGSMAAWGYVAWNTRGRNSQLLAIAAGALVFIAFTLIGLADVRVLGALVFIMLFFIGIYLARMFQLQELSFLWFVSIFWFLTGNILSVGLDTVGAVGLAATELSVDMNNDSTLTQIAVPKGGMNGFVTTSGQNLLYIDNEILSFTGPIGTGFPTTDIVNGVTRAINGTESAPHSAGTPVYNRVAGRINRAVAYNVSIVQDNELGARQIIGVVFTFFTDMLPAFIVWDYSWMSGNFVYLRYFGMVIGAVTMVLSWLRFVSVLRGGS